jgi:hypothetical protein
MKRIVIFGAFLLAASNTLFAAQLYRWVDEKGAVEWRDTPPPSDAKQVERRTITGGTSAAVDAPYSVQQAMKNFPVSLWVTNCGDSCDRARAHLARRGVPYSEKNALADVETFRKTGGEGMELPLLIVGSRQLKGYRESDWDSVLDAAGYPRSPYVGYKAPAPVPDPKTEAGQQPGTAPQPGQPKPAR